MAINGGIYKKHGFDVENIQVGSSATVVQSLIAGEVGFAHVGAVPVVAAVANGIDLKIIAGVLPRIVLTTSWSLYPSYKSLRT